MAHISVLPKEVLEYLDPKPNENFIDCTLGDGGHSLAILGKTGPKGKVLSIDADLKAIENFQLKIKNLENRIILVCDNFNNLQEIVRKNNFSEVKGIIFDLGLSSRQLEESARGFSFLKDEPLDMRYSTEHPLTAEEIINSWPMTEIENILKEFGEENFANRIANAIIKERKIRPIKTTFQLVKIIQNAIPFKYQRQRIHFATRTFQALRIAVNQELECLTKVLPQAMEILSDQGKLIVISFHSLEDRIVKIFLRGKAKQGILKLINKKPITPSEEEIKINPRSRSAKMRAAIKICQK